MNADDALKKLLNGEMKLHEIDEALGDANEATATRRAFIEKKLNVSLKNVSGGAPDFNALVGRNIENPIGTAQLPMGVAGPVKISGEFAKGDFYVPLSTTEGALVASVSRGCAAITESGGATVRILRNRMTRAPAFKVKDVAESKRLAGWVKANFDKLREVAEKDNPFMKMVSVEPFVIGRYVYVRLGFETGDAMGMNMVTFGSESVAMFIEENFAGARCVTVTSNVCTDKKPSALNMVLGRGRSVAAEVVLPASVVESRLKTTVEKFIETNIVKNLIGSALAGSYGFNAHFANVIAAVYIATGQDPAHVVEGSMGFTVAEREGDNLRVSVTLPCVQVGTVGGGTGIGTQKEALGIMGVAGSGSPPGNNAAKFAEIVACAVLAGEISLVAALAAGHLGRAHKDLGRGEKKAGKN